MQEIKREILFAWLIGLVPTTIHMQVKSRIQYFDFGKVEILNSTFPVLKLEFNILTFEVEILNSNFPKSKYYTIIE